MATVVQGKRKERRRYISGRRGSCKVLSGRVKRGVEEEEGCRAWKLRLIGRLPGGGIRREIGVSNAFRWKSRGDEEGREERGA